MPGYGARGDGWAGMIARVIDAMAMRTVAPSAAMGEARLCVTRQGVTSATPRARALLGEAARPGAPASALQALLAEADPAAAAAFDALLARGDPMRMRLTLPGAGPHEITGRPEGGECALVLTDAAVHAAALDVSERARAEAEAEAATLRAALDATGAPVWLIDAAGATRWSSAGARGRPAAPGEAARRVAAPGEPVGEPGAEPSGERDLERAGRFVALVDERSGQSPPDVVLRRFIETVTETFAHLRVGLAIYDAERRLTLANPAVAEIFGADPAWLAGRPTLRETLDRLREARQLPEQLDYPAWRATLFTLFDDISRASYEERWELPDGRSIHVVGRPHPLGGIAFIFEDVTESIALQRWRSTAVEVRRATLDLLADGVVVFGPDGQTRMANPAFVELWRLGARFDDAPRHLSDIERACTPLAPEAPIWETVRDAIAGGGGRKPSTNRMALSDGRVLSARIAPMPDGSTLAAFSDVSDGERIAAALRERAETLEAAEDMRDALLDQISHRLRTPLNAIMGFAEALADGGKRDAAAERAYLNNIRSAAGALLEGVESLAALVSTGPRIVERARGAVAVAHALRGALGLLERRLAERGVRIDLRPLPETAAALGDPARIRQLIFNMLADATATVAPGETLAIGVDDRGDTLDIWCLGPSLALGRTETPGLAQARRAAEAQGGGITLDLPRGGTPRLTCRLPAAQPSTWEGR